MDSNGWISTLSNISIFHIKYKSFVKYIKLYYSEAFIVLRLCIIGLYLWYVKFPFLARKTETLIFDLSDFICGGRLVLPRDFRLSELYSVYRRMWWIYRYCGTEITIPGVRSDASISFALQISNTARLVSVSSDLYVLAISHNVSP